jgi:phage recombination protein Bet
MSKALQILEEQTDYSIEELQTIKNQYASDATDVEFFAFMKLAKLRNLNPFAREIYFVKRKSKYGDVVAHQVGIDGWRKIAALHPDWAGPGDVAASDWKKSKEEGKEFSHPDMATATYYRFIGQGSEREKVAVTATIRWSEFYPGGKMGYMWRSKPELMLKKCAEAQAIRMAFPEAVSGIDLDGAGPVENAAPAQVIEAVEEEATELEAAILRQEEPKKEEPKKEEKTNVEPEKKAAKKADKPANKATREENKKADDSTPKPKAKPVTDGPISRVKLSEQLVAEMCKVAEILKLPLDRDKILEKFGKKSVAELTEEHHNRMQTWINNNKPSDLPF